MNWKEFVEGYRRERPLAEGRDIYKLIHQAFFGPGHAIADREGAVRWLKDEWDCHGNATADVFERIHPDGTMFRLNIVPARKAGHSLDDVLSAFLLSAAEVAASPPSADEFREAVLSAGIRDGTLLELSRRNPPPAVHHSKGYREAYSPHYRVITRREMERLVGHGANEK